ncbi:MAG: DUF928 domain-containing protein [Kamptonema sp. SIO4C4]|nr:DUF928 domain-containing protein [Kamptonema sp. SIO4C4]
MMTRLLVFLTTLIALLTLQIASFVTLARADKYDPSNSDTGPPPDYTSDTGVRSPPCLTETAQLTLLIPQRQETETGMTDAELDVPPYGITTEAQPTLLLYVPPTDATYGELTIKDSTQWGTPETESLLYLEFSPPPEGGIIQIPLSEVMNDDLEVGEWYEWSVIVPCDQFSENLVSRTGLIKRVQLSEPVIEQIMRTPPSLQPKLYAEKGIWYEAVCELAHLLQDQPDDAALQNRWLELLNSAGLQALSEVPVLDCCTVEQLPQ